MSYFCFCNFNFLRSPLHEMNLREVMRIPLRLWNQKTRNFPVDFLGEGVDMSVGFDIIHA
jgi:hypothetical protein